MLGCFLLGGDNMAQDWAKSFYNSKKWIKCRELYKQEKNGLCERCLKRGIYNPGEEVHHKIYLTPENINNPEITLNWDRLELLCATCHSKEHNEKHSPLRDDVMFDENGDLIEKKTTNF